MMWSIGLPESTGLLIVGEVSRDFLTFISIRMCNLRID